MKAFERAFEKRKELGLWDSSEPLRLFHGPGEALESDEHEWRGIAVDRYGDHLWITLWEEISPAALDGLRHFLASRFHSGVILHRPNRALPQPTAQTFFGAPPHERFEVREGSLRLWIKLLGSRHPGLFLDHAGLRRWLEQNSEGLTVLNAFAYTGSLSLACAAGGAASVVTTDLSRTTLDWARDNWNLNGLPTDRAAFIAADAFELFPKLIKRGECFDRVILDPPSFSRGKKRAFSTQKDLSELHALALKLVKPGGSLVTAINSANVSREKFRKDVLEAARAVQRRIEFDREIEQPASFPWRANDPSTRYLKGWILRA